MIRRLKHNEIDFEKYDECILNSKQYRIYAESWYLDAVSNKKWDCLVYGDYEAVMPIPFDRKFVFKRIIQPLFCQQLGVFYNNEISKNIFEEFHNKLKKCRVGSYQFNEENTYDFNPEGNLKNNFLLSLNDEYELIFSNFKRDRKKDIRRIEKKGLKIHNTFDFTEFRQDLIENYPHLEKFYSSLIFSHLIKGLQLKKRLMYSDLRTDEQIVSRLLIADSGQRKIVLFSSRDFDNQYKGAFTFLLNNFIKNNANQKIIIDFEGSMISGIAEFNKSFGAEIRKYFVYKNI